MSVRYRITHDEWINGNKIRYRADILDDEYGGDVIEHIAGGVFFDWEYDKIDERDPFSDPVQRSGFAIDFLVQSATEESLLSDIIDAPEDRFQINFYIDDTLSWSGRVLSDLVEYPEKGYPFLVKIMAKDLSSLSGVDYTQFTDATRTRLSVIIADILKNTGLTLPIRAFTNLTHTQVTQADDFLFSIYHQKKAFQNRNKAMNNLEVLENICRAYNLIIRQIGGRWIIEQLTGVAKGDVTQFDYDSDGINPTSSTPDRTITVDGTDSFLLPTSNNKITGAIKSIESTYNHRTDIRNILTTSDITPVPFDTLVRSIDIDTEDRFRVAVHFDVEVETATGGHSDISGQMTISIRSKTEDSVYFLHNDGDFKIGSPPQGDRITITLDGSDNIATGSISLDNQGPTPEGALNVIADITDSPFTGIALEDENENQLLVDRVTLTKVNIYIYNVDTRDYNAAISHIMRRTGDFSVLERVPVTVIGDGPELQSVGIPAKGANESDDLVEGDFKIRGVTENVKLEELTLRERINMRRQAMRNMRADLWMNYSPENLISYNGDRWFFLGGHFVANRSRWSASILALDYNTGEGDTFQRFVESGGAPTGTATEASSTTGDGVTLEQGDERWLNVLENLADLNNIVTARTNLGLGNLAVLDTVDTAQIVDNAVTLDKVPFADQELLEASNVQFAQIHATGDVNVGTEQTQADLHIFGDIFQHGEHYETHIQKLYTEKDYIITRDGAEGALGEGELSGLQVKIPDGTNDMFFGTDKEGVMRIGETTDLQSLMTREEVGDMHDGGLVLFDTTSWKSYTDAGLTYADNTLLFTGDGGSETLVPKLEADNFSSWFTAQPKGWQIAYNGIGDFRTLFIDELIAKAFTVDVAQALAGSDFLTKSVSTLSRNFTIPAVSSTGKIYVDDLPGLESFQAFEVGDWLRLRIVDRTDGLTIGDVWGTVAGYTDEGDGEQSWDFTVDYAGPTDGLVGQVVHKGAVVLDYGVSGDYYIERTVLDRTATTDFTRVPYRRIVQWTNTVSGSPRPGDPDTVITVVEQSGNLATMTGTYSEVSGFGYLSENFFATGALQIGNLNDTGEDFLKYSAGELSAVLSEIDITIGEDGKNRIFADSTGVDIKATKFDLRALDVNDAGIQIDSDNRRVALLSDNEYESLVVQLGYDAANVDLVNSQAFDLFNLTIQNILDNGSDIDSAGIYTPSDNELHTEMKCNIAGVHGADSNWKVRVNVRVTTGLLEGVSSTSFEMSEADSRIVSLIMPPFSSVDGFTLYVSIEEVDITATTTTEDGVEVSDISFSEYNPKTWYNEKGGFQRISPDTVLAFGSGGGGGGIGTLVSEVQWSNVLNKPFSTVGNGLTTASDTLAVDLSASDIPNLDANKITTGEFSLDRIPIIPHFKTDFTDQNLREEDAPNFRHVKSIKAAEDPVIWQNRRFIAGVSSTEGDWGAIHWHVDNAEIQLVHSGYHGQNGALKIGASGDVAIPENLTVTKDVTGANLNVSNWNTAYTERITGVSGDGNSMLILTKPQTGVDDLETDLSHTHPSSELTAAAGYAIPGRALGTAGDMAELNAGENGVLRRVAAGDLGFGTLANSNLDNSSITVTAGDGLITGGSVALGSSVTVALGAPSTLTSTTTNAKTTTSHTHAITNHALSGTANQVSVSGSPKVLGGDTTLSLPQDIHLGASPTFVGLTLSGLTATRIPYATTDGAITDSANLVFDGTDISLVNASFGTHNALTGTLGDARYGTLASANNWTATNTFYDTIRSEPFTTGQTGWALPANGNGEFRNTQHDSIMTKAFIAEISQALFGSDILTKSGGELAEDFVIPDFGYTSTLTVYDLPGFKGFQNFSSGDFLLLQGANRMAGAQSIWGTVTGYVDNEDGTQSWDFTTLHIGSMASQSYNDYRNAVEAQGGEINDRDATIALFSQIPNSYSDYKSAVNAQGGVINDENATLALFKDAEVSYIGDTIYAGAWALDYGQSGDAFDERTVLGEFAPFQRQVRWTLEPWDGSNYEIISQTGEMDGLGLSGVSGNGVYTSRFYGTELIRIGDLKDTPDGDFFRYENGTLSYAGNLVGEDMELSGLLDVGGVELGRNVGGTSFRGLFYNAANRWLNDTGAGKILFRVGGGAGIDYDSSRTPYPLHIGANTKFEGALTGVDIIGDVILDGGKITNKDEDYIIDKDGIRLKMVDSFSTGSTIAWGDSYETYIIGEDVGGNKQLLISSIDDIRFDTNKISYINTSIFDLTASTFAPTWKLNASKFENLQSITGYLEELEIKDTTKISDTTASTSATSGALQVAGGIGVAKDSFFGGQITADSINGVNSTAWRKLNHTEHDGDPDPTYNVTDNDEIIYINDSIVSGLTVNIPAAQETQNRTLTIKEVAQVNGQTISANSNIDGSSANITLDSLEWIKIHYDGTAWWIIARG